MQMKREQLEDEFRKNPSLRSQSVYQREVASAVNATDASQVPTRKQVEHIKRKVAAEETPFGSVSHSDSCLINFFFIEDIANLIEVYKGYVLDIHLWSNQQSSPEVIFSTHQMLELLVQFGQEIFFIDGTHSIIENRMQVVALSVVHPEGK